MCQRRYLHSQYSAAAAAARLPTTAAATAATALQGDEGRVQAAAAAAVAAALRQVLHCCWRYRQHDRPEALPTAAAAAAVAAVAALQRESGSRSAQLFAPSAATTSKAVQVRWLRRGELPAPPAAALRQVPHC